MKRTIDTRRLTQLALLTALLLVMNYTPLGYLPVGPLTMSLLTIPVAIGAMLLGPATGAWLGTVFGLTSFINAVEGKSAMTGAAFQYSPVLCFIMCVVARALMGLCCGLIYRAVTKALPEKEKLCAAIGGVSAPLLNTCFFMGSLVLFFYNIEFVQGLVEAKGATNPLMFVVLMVGVQGMLEAIICCVVSAAVTVPVKHYLKSH